MTAVPRRSLLRVPARTFRARLATTYALLLTAAGALMMAIVYIVVVLLPTYAFSALSPTVPDNIAGVSPLPSEPQVPQTLVDATNLDVGVLSVPGVLVESRDDLQQLVLIVGCAIILLLAAAGAFAGWVIAGRMLRPLHEVSLAAQQAATGRLDHRLGMGEPRDEVTELASTFDGMLDSLEASFHAHQRFAANASHELRTPLATTRTMLDVALPFATGRQRELLVGLRQMNERSIETVTALLDLADIEASRGDPLGAVDLAALAADTASEVMVEAAGAGVTVRTRLESASVRGDARLLRLLLGNLMRNAVRHNLDGGTALVTLSSAGVLVVENTGRPIGQAEIDGLREAFARSSGRTAGRGHGLGLAIATAVAERHGTTLDLAPRDGGGLIATVRFSHD